MVRWFTMLSGATERIVAIVVTTIFLLAAIGEFLRSDLPVAIILLAVSLVGVTAIIGGLWRVWFAK